MGSGRVKKKEMFRIAGALMAWVIGAGFATGQESLRFFSSFGYYGYAVVTINFIGFLLFAYLLMRCGFENKERQQFNQFVFFCGEKCGAFYTTLTVIALIFIMSVLISGSGATLHQYYGVHQYIGSAAMAVLVWIAYIIGFNRLVNVVSFIGPVIIIFSLAVGVLTVCRDASHFWEVAQNLPVLEQYQAAPFWLLSGFLYLGLTFFPGSAYFARLGMIASSDKEIKYGVLIGVMMVIGCITLITTAILLNAGAATGLSIPVLFLARKISWTLGMVFSVMLVLGIFCSCSAMMWTVCSRFNQGRGIINRLFSIAIVVITYVISLFSFGELVGVLYPLVGYAGLIFLSCVVYKSWYEGWILHHKTHKIE